ncbi:hypothetical protein TanjilG_07533 [Lupinus angustifolius]|uniref:Uncharacterized protein n=1 Tax=Lupinus angustifolius TaxID=3871 RepID=A0A1J7IS79_LUPAN|nr:hypothetical protein TanjilG_07533 [Lupinus angustifolius]
MDNVINEHKEAKSIAKEDQAEVQEDLVDVLLKFEDGNGINQDICLTKNNIKAILQIYCLHMPATKTLRFIAPCCTTQIEGLIQCFKFLTSLVLDWAMSEMRDVFNEKESSIDYKENKFEYIPFGAGRRICPRSTFGLMSVEMALAFLSYHSDWKLPNGMKNEDLDATEVFGVTIRRKEDLYLIPIAFRPSLAT